MPGPWPWKIFQSANTDNPQFTENNGSPFSNKNNGRLACKSDGPLSDVTPSTGVPAVHTNAGFAADQLRYSPANPATAAPIRRFPFKILLGNFVSDRVNDKQVAAGDAICNGLLSGKNVSLHQTMIAMEEASVSFQMMVEVRNKLLDSYQELMRMQI